MRTKLIVHCPGLVACTMSTTRSLLAGVRGADMVAVATALFELVGSTYTLADGVVKRLKLTAVSMAPLVTSLRRCDITTPGTHVAVLAAAACAAMRAAIIAEDAWTAG